MHPLTTNFVNGVSEFGIEKENEMTVRVLPCTMKVFSADVCCEFGFMQVVQLLREELQSIQRELEVLSEQYSQKCLENAHLAQALEAERQALRQCQRENQELNAHNQVCTRMHMHTLTTVLTVTLLLFPPNRS